MKGIGGIKEIGRTRSDSPTCTSCGADCAVLSKIHSCRTSWEENWTVCLECTCTCSLNGTVRVPLVGGRSWMGYDRSMDMWIRISKMYVWLDGWDEPFFCLLVGWIKVDGMRTAD
jgi:hypothetical protein